MKLTRQAWTAIRAMIVLTIVLGIVYPAVIWVVGLAMPSQSNGSLLRDSEGRIVGSSLIGQSFTDAKGNPLPQWFQPRPSAAGETGYDAGASSGSNWGPENPDLIKAITERKAQIAAFDGVDASQVPPDAVTASASGLDPDISESYALIQVNRVAAARHLEAGDVKQLVEQHVEPRLLGFIGEPVVNVVELNLALSQLK
jgi:potassium-transporting ATPase KdpC subunit